MFEALWLMFRILFVCAGLWIAKKSVGQPRNRRGAAVEHMGVFRVISVLILEALLLVAATIAGKLIGLTMFGMIHLAYLLLVVVLPIFGVMILASHKRSKHQLRYRRADRLVRWAATAMICAIPVGIYTSFIEPYRLQLEQVKVSIAAERAGSAPICIGVLADIQTDRITDYEREAIDRLMAEKPDVILIAGDYFQGSAKQYNTILPAFRELLSRLEAPHGVYAVTGNIDSLKDLNDLAQGTKVEVLYNSTRTVTIADRTLTIGGISPNYQSASAPAVLKGLTTAAGDDIRVLLSHHPDVIDMTGDRIDLIVAGHTHGGQIALPFYGPLMTKSKAPRRIAAGGLHATRGTQQIYVSRGLGFERGQAPPMRFWCPPEITILTLE